MPASPASSSIRPSPRIAANSASSSSVSSDSRPTSTGHRARTTATMPRMLAALGLGDSPSPIEAVLTEQRSLERLKAIEPERPCVLAKPGRDATSELVLEIPLQQVLRLESGVRERRVLEPDLHKGCALPLGAFDQLWILAGNAQVIQVVTRCLELRRLVIHRTRAS